MGAWLTVGWRARQVGVGQTMRKVALFSALTASPPKWSVFFASARCLHRELSGLVRRRNEADARANHSYATLRFALLSSVQLWEVLI